MSKIPRTNRIVAAALALFALGLSDKALAADGPLVMAAASLQEALNAEADAWAARGHPRPVLALAASSALARQIEAGAPADIFISADEQWMNDVAAKHLIILNSRADLVGNALVLVAPAQSQVRLRIAPGFALATALGSGRLAVGTVASVPAGIYAKQALTSLGVWVSVAGRLAEAESVRAALALVDRGEAPLGIVYATDARADKAVRVVASFPATCHPPIRYPIALLTASHNADAAGFARFLRSPAGLALFRAHGFSAPK